jgi:hypothetical protein
MRRLSVGSSLPMNTGRAPQRQARFRENLPLAISRGLQSDYVAIYAVS